MSDSLLLRDLELWVRLGVPDNERAAPQRVLVTVQFPLDAAAVAAADDLRDAVDYAETVRLVRETERTEYRTLERLTEDIARTLLARQALPSVTVSVTKFPLPGLRDVTLTITRP
jgi:FolB domain-containing protein